MIIKFNTESERGESNRALKVGAFSVIVKTDGPFAALMITYIRDSDPSIFSNNNADVDIYFVILYSVIFIGYILLRLKTAWGWGCYQDNDEV